MNYLAHGFRFLDQPLFLTGTAVPDLLRVSDPHVRVPAKLTEAALRGSDDGSFNELCRGILQHHADDDRFHASTPFQEISEELARAFRILMPDRFDHRPGLLGHIVTELLLDNELARRDPELLPRYYKAIGGVDSLGVQGSVDRIVRRPCSSLAQFIELFCEIRFLFDYANNERLMFRLNQVLKRAKLPPLDEAVFPVFDTARNLLKERADELVACVRDD